MAKFKKGQRGPSKGKDEKGVIDIKITLRKKGGVEGFPEPGNRVERIVLEDTTVGEVFNELNALLFPPELDEDE